MKRCLLRYLKAGLIGLVFVPSLLWAADSPRVSVDSNSLGANKADIGLVTTINFNNHVDLQINPGGQGCSAGQFWDVRFGRCSSATKLRSESTSKACDCSCPGTGSCSASQSGTYDVFGWQLPTDGHELISYNGPTNWGACSITSNNCQAVTPPDSGGGTASVGMTYKLTAMICGSSDSNYYTPPANTPLVARNLIISTYRSWVGGRCPEASGFANWVAHVNSFAYKRWGSNPGVPDDATYIAAFTGDTLSAILAAAEEKGEHTYQGIVAANFHCQQAATEKYGSTAKAEYLLNSGNQCIVTVP